MFAMFVHEPAEMMFLLPMKLARFSLIKFGKRNSEHYDIAFENYHIAKKVCYIV